MTDWLKIKAEYITSTISYRALADKHNVPISTLQRRATKEGWPTERSRSEANIVAKSVVLEENKRVNRYTRLLTVADKLLDKIEHAVDSLNDTEILGMIDKSTLRSISGALKDIKDIQNLKSDIELREQEARIRNLERQANIGDDDEDETGVVLLPPVIAEEESDV